MHLYSIHNATVISLVAGMLLACDSTPGIETYCNTTRAEIEGSYEVELSCQAIDSSCYASCLESKGADADCSKEPECLGEAKASEATLGLSMASHLESLNMRDITHWLWSYTYVSSGDTVIDRLESGAKCDSDSGGEATANMISFSLPAAQGTRCAIRAHALNTEDAPELGQEVLCEESLSASSAAPSKLCTARVTKVNDTPPDENKVEFTDRGWNIVGTDSFLEPPLNINALWVFNKDSAFAVGELGLALHYDGNSWQIMSTGVLTNLRAIWGSSESKLYAAGSMGRVLHFDGKEWTQVAGAQSPEESSSYEDHVIHSIWAASPSEIYTVGSHIHRFNGDTWEEIEASFEGTLSGIWGSSSENIYVVGEEGVWHFDGKLWSSIESPIQSPLAISGTASDNIFISGWWGGLAHFDGTQWSTTEPLTSQSLVSVWTAADKEAYAIGNWSDREGHSRVLHYKNGTTTASLAPATLRSVHGQEGAVFTAGEKLKIFKKLEQ